MWLLNKNNFSYFMVERGLPLGRPLSFYNAAVLLKTKLVLLKTFFVFLRPNFCV